MSFARIKRKQQPVLITSKRNYPFSLHIKIHLKKNEHTLMHSQIHMQSRENQQKSPGSPIENSFVLSFSVTTSTRCCFPHFTVICNAYAYTISRFSFKNILFYLFQHKTGKKKETNSLSKSIHCALFALKMPNM